MEESRIVGLVSPLTGNVYTSRMDFESLLSTNNTHAGALYKAGQKIRKLKAERQKGPPAVTLGYMATSGSQEAWDRVSALEKELEEAKEESRKQMHAVALIQSNSGEPESRTICFDELLLDRNHMVNLLRSARADRDAAARELCALKRDYKRLFYAGRQRLYGVDLIQVDKGTPFGTQVHFDMLLTDRNELATKLHAAEAGLEAAKAELEATKAELAKPRVAFEWETIIKTIKESDEHVYKLGHADGNVRFCIIPHAHNYTPRYLLDPESCAYTKIPYVGGYPQSSQGIVYTRDSLANDIMSRLVQVTRQPK